MSTPSEFLKKVEYRVKPITRYVVTRYEEGTDESIEEGPKSWSGTTERGNFDNFITAFEVASSLCGAEHASLGWPVDDDRMQYPKIPHDGRGPG